MSKREYNFNRMKKGEAKLFIKTQPAPVLAPKQPKLQKKTLERRSEAIWKFLEKRPHLARKRLAEDCGWHVGNLCNYEKKKSKIPQKHLLKLEKILELYGLTVFA